jgi:hypothetical protein
MYRLLLEVEWLESTHNRVLSIDGGPMWFSERMECWHNWRPGRAMTRKWRILDGKEGEWFDMKFKAPRWYPPPMSVKD